MNGLTRHIRLEQPAMMCPIFAQLRRGPGDPTHRWLGDIRLRATRTPAGPALIKILANGTQVSARAWGEGAEWSLDQLPRLLGAADDPSAFRPRPDHAPLVEAWQRYGHYRVGRTEAVFEALAPACIEQVVTGKEAFRAWRLLVREFGEPAPGPAREPGTAAYGMYLPPTSRGVVSGAELAVPRCRGRATAEPHPGPYGHQGDGFGAHPDWLLRAG